MCDHLCQCSLLSLLFPGVFHVLKNCAQSENILLISIWPLISCRNILKGRTAKPVDSHFPNCFENLIWPQVFDSLFISRALSKVGAHTSLYLRMTIWVGLEHAGPYPLILPHFSSQKTRHLIQQLLPLLFIPLVIGMAAISSSILLWSQVPRHPRCSRFVSST